MIRQCRRGKVDLVLVKSISRFARNTVDCLNYIRALRTLGIAVIFEKENINTLETDSEDDLYHWRYPRWFSAVRDEILPEPEDHVP